MEESQLIKASAAGLAQTLVNRGYDDRAVANAVILYTDSNNGLIVKRASNLANVRTQLHGLLGALRSQL